MPRKKTLTPYHAIAEAQPLPDLFRVAIERLGVAVHCGELFDGTIKSIVIVAVGDSAPAWLELVQEFYSRTGITEEMVHGAGQQEG